LAADATVPAAPAARRNDRRLHIVDLIKNLLDLSGVHVDDHIYLAAESYASYPVDSTRIRKSNQILDLLVGS
jgi:hypothetical protein